jgi:hypothetical protein
MQKNEIKPTTYIIVGFAIISFIIIAIIAIFYKINSGSDSGATDTNSYTDPKSGETIVNPEGKSPEISGINPDAPVYLGFSNLLEVGFSDEQVQETKDVLLDFMTSKNLKKAEISLDKESLKQTIDSSTGVATYTFKFTVDRKQNYMATILISDISSVDMSIYSDSSKTKIFSAVKGE